LLGLDPQETYWFDTTLKTSPTRFHLYKVPDDFAGVMHMESRTAPQEFSSSNGAQPWPVVSPRAASTAPLDRSSGDVFFYLNFSGHGEIGAYVPPEYDAYLNGRKLQVNPQTHEATAKVDGGKPAPGSMGYHIELTPDITNKATSQPKGPAQLIAFRRSETQLD